MAGLWWRIDEAAVSRPVPGEVLGDLGPIVISDRAAREFADALPKVGHPPRHLEDARRWLAEYLTEARQVRAESEAGATQWRRRSHSARLDVMVMTDIQEGRVVVTHARVRYYAPRKRRR